MKVKLHAVLIDQQTGETAYQFEELVAEIKRVLHQELMLDIAEFKVDQVRDWYGCGRWL